MQTRSMSRNTHQSLEIISYRWPENLSTYRERFSRSREVSLCWTAYIAEICHEISYNNANYDVLTDEEYKGAYAFMHGKL